MGQEQRKKTTIGGQALLEGLMMVGPDKTATAFRRRDGSILVEYRDPIPPASSRKIPIVRGAVGIFRQMVAGTRALMRSAELIEEDDRREEAAKQMRSISESSAAGEVLDTKTVEVTVAPPSPATKWVLYGSAAVGVLGGIVLFVLLPNLLADLLLPSQAGKQSYATGVLYNLIEGAVRLILLLGYFYLCNRLPDMKQIWRYHGAEHKTIACYEAGDPLTPEQVMRHSRFHPRCGTSFLFLFVFLSILLFSVVGWHSALVNLLIRLALVPVLAGLSYEVLRWTGKHDGQCLCRWIARPGLWVQKLTTAEPDEKICEVAIAALRAVLPEQTDADQW